MHVWSLRIGSLFAALSLLVFATSVATADQNLKMELSEFKFTPNSATLTPGETANFTLANVGRFPHNLTIQAPDGSTTTVVSANVAPGATGTGSYKFAQAGTYQFWCPVGQHKANGMVGTFQVNVGGGAPLPRTGDLPFELVGGGLAGLAGLSFVSGWVLRRRA